MPKLTINGTEIEVEKGTSILQAAELLGVEIPRFCYHDRLSVPANCRMCLVEMEGAPKPVASCALACGDGMVIKTTGEVTAKARKGVMEMLLINHPLDCPICDQGGECDLQDQAVAFGFDRSRYHENKRAVPDKELGPIIKTSMNRCIQCTRCVRFGEEIAGVEDLGMLNRGENSEIGTFIEKAVGTELSGNMVDICPVGALTSKPYAFKARPWELTKTETIDVMDAVGCNIRLDSRGGEVLRVLPRLNENINEEWINDRTRYHYDGLSKKRLDRPWIRDEEGGKLRPANWEEALAFIAQKLSVIGPNEIAGLVGDLVDVESVVAFKDLLQSLGTPHMECRTDSALYDASARANYLLNSGIENLENADAVLIVGANPRYEATLVNTRLRKAALRGAEIAMIGVDADLTYPTWYLGADMKALDAVIKGKGDFAEILKNAQRPAVIFGAGAFTENASISYGLIASLIKEYNLVREGWNGVNILHNAAARVGALDVGFLPQEEGKSLPEIIAGTKDGSIKALYLLGVDNIDLRAAISWKTFVIYQGHHGDLGAARADVVLPGAAYSEKDGIYVNTEGRPQLCKRAVFPPGEAREDWKIFRALSEYFNRPLPYNNFTQLRQRVFEAWPHLGEIDRIEPSEIALPKAGKGKLSEPFVALGALENFYANNAVTRASEIMRRCEGAFLKSEKKKTAA